MMNNYIIVEDSEDENKLNEENRNKPETFAQNSKSQKRFELNKQETNDEFMILDCGEYNFQGNQRNESKSKNITQNKISPPKKEKIKKFVEIPPQMNKRPLFPERKVMITQEDANTSLKKPISNLKFA